MSRLLTRVAMVVVGLLVLGGLTFGATQAFGSARQGFCGDDLGELGLCPPYTSGSCDEACIEAEFFGGDCIPYGGPGQCCACLT
jgi:hypothetical protein